MFKQYKLKNYKFILIALVVILNTIGVALVGSASPGDQKKQIIGMVSGIIIMLLVSYIDYNFILRFSWLIYLGAIGLLGLVIVAGEQSKGAQRWFKIGFNRAARIMDQLEEAGIVGPEEGTKPRRVLMSPEQFEQYEEEYL